MVNNFFNIPIIDISQEEQYFRVVDKEDGVYLGHVTTAMLEDQKTIYAVYPKSHGKGAIVLKRSDDAGVSFGERLPVPKSWATSFECPILYRTVDKDGHYHLILFSGLRPLRMAHSEDDGKTWSELEPVGNFGGVCSLGSITPLGEGRYLGIFHDTGMAMGEEVNAKYTCYTKGSGTDIVSRYTLSVKNPDGTWEEETCDWIHAYDNVQGAWEKTAVCELAKFEGKPDDVYTVYTTLSEDGGLTWSYPTEIFKSDEIGLCEPHLIRSPDGKELACLLRENKRVKNSMLMISRDNGKTWSEPRELPLSLTGDRQTAKYLPDGRLFISFRDMARNSPTKCSWVGWVGTYDDIVSGRDGQYRILFKRTFNNFYDCAYPGVEILPDGTIVSVTYGRWETKDYSFIYRVRLNIKDFDEKYAKGEGFLTL